MDGHRRYAEEPEPTPSWYSGQGQYASPEPSAYESGVHERPSGAFRLPEQREGAQYATSDSGSHSQEQLRIPVRGPEYPTVKPPEAQAVAAYNEPTGVVPPVNRYQPGSRSFRNRRPVSAVLVGIVTLVLMIPVIMLLVQAMFNDDPLVAGVVPAVLLTLGLPLTGLGLFSLASTTPSAREAWMRPPVVYLPVGLVLILAAGLAVS